jgi:glucose-6-phosphate 1-dehydrogenase
MSDRTDPDRADVLVIFGITGDFTDPSTYQNLATTLAGARNPVCYLETPPSLFGPVVTGLGRAGLTRTGRVVVEKPLLRLDTRAEDGNPAAYNWDRVHGREGEDLPSPYEVLLHAAMIGNPIRFARQDGVEQHWRITQPLLDKPPTVETYAPGTWGPPGAHRLVAGHSDWHEPWMES